MDKKKITMTVLIVVLTLLLICNVLGIIGNLATQPVVHVDPVSGQPAPAAAPISINPTDDKADGYYLVGSEIAPGTWRTEKGRSGCYWGVSNKDGAVTSNSFGMGGGTLIVPPSAYEIKLQGCGITKLQK